MSISCSCGSLEDAAWTWWDDDSPAEPYMGRRAVRCFSCRTPIRPGDIHYSFARTRDSRNDYEERRYGDEVGLAPLRLCEECGDMHINITDTGLCVALEPGVSVKQQWKEYINDLPS